MTTLDVLLVNALSTWGLVGLIWHVQLVQYPSFLLVAERDLRAFHDHHCARIAWVVAPLMAVELGTTIMLWAPAPLGLDGALRAPLSIGTGLLALIWLTTALISVPLHVRLPRGAQSDIHALVRSNWIRTLAWSLRGALVIVLLRASLPSG